TLYGCVLKPEGALLAISKDKAAPFTISGLDGEAYSKVPVSLSNRLNRVQAYRFITASSKEEEAVSTLTSDGCDFKFVTYDDDDVGKDEMDLEYLEVSLLGMVPYDGKA
ncbi:MAG: hypothetical protein SGBAC_007183, partial [Bacillariaceae sp.]